MVNCSFCNIMAFRRKSPSASQLSLHRQLQLICNCNAMSLPFQPHNAQSLIEQLKLHSPVAFEQFTKRATRQDFVPSWLVSSSGIGTIVKDAPIFTLPLPQHFLGSPDDTEDITPRKFYHSSMVEKNIDHEMRSYTPRCGLTGLFYSREEVIDNLQAAAAELQFKSPFWIRADHPELGNFLALKDGSDVICVGLTAAVVSVDDVESVPTKLLHPSLQRAVESHGFVFGEDVPLGMNALTGIVTENPFVQGLPNRGVWLSQSQVLQNNLVLRRDASRSAPYQLVEVEQWELYNADQLLIPGRVALDNRTSKGLRSDSLFS
ncbi:hypothetical protein TRVL_07434 [Trypanosoma vivax]|uniref:Trypanosoma Tc-38 (p38) protein domain-containing protein n=1 Tax=Trypanosoma vivax (strain Y486) TaxID=1055687 RepID=F9WNX9_TRYVY|nr:hypothetical protein TRVL_07434 [Trypanosoma vivax]CCD19251.1 hypothetical protein, conserved [Trypanosoma vivax Y486]|eukprot:CCD19251.1 hypothetical protein, conserved [Trypanosoma vivax Y486]